MQLHSNLDCSETAAPGSVWGRCKLFQQLRAWRVRPPTQLQLQIPEAKFIPAPSPTLCITVKSINKKVESTTALLLLPTTVRTSLFVLQRVLRFFSYPVHCRIYGDFSFSWPIHTSSLHATQSSRPTSPPWPTQSRASVRALIRRSRSPRELRDSTAARAPLRTEPQRRESAVR